jgi:hypothetical protein
MPDPQRNLNVNDGRAGLTKKDEQRATRALEKAVGGRDAVRQALSLVQKNKHAEILHAYLADPRNNRLELAELCRRAGISVPQLWGMFRDGAFTKAQIAALAKVCDGLPAVAADVMRRAIEHQVRCPECHGEGRVSGPTAALYVKRGAKVPKCHVCHGTGSVPQAPELKTQELALEIGGLLHREKAGVQVNVTQEQALQVANVERGFTDFQHETDAILFDARRVAPSPPPEAEPELADRSDVSS